MNNPELAVDSVNPSEPKGETSEEVQTKEEVASKEEKSDEQPKSSVEETAQVEDTQQTEQQSEKETKPQENEAEEEVSQDIKKTLKKLEDLLEREEHLLKSKQMELKEKQKGLREILDQWKDIGDVQNRKFQKLKEQFNQKTSELINEIDWERWSNQKRKEDLAKEAESLLENQNGAEVLKKVRELQANWKTVGQSFKADEALWKRFREACDKAYTFSQSFLETQDEEREKICAQAEALSKSTEINKVFSEFKNLQKKWEEMGAPVRPKAWEIDKRFRKAANLFFKKRREFFTEKDKEKSDNLTKKQALVEKAEHWVKEEDWNRSLPEIQKLQEMWKGIGPVPQKISDELWKKFKRFCDEVYAKRRAANDKKFAEFNENLNKMKAVCEELEKVVEEDDRQAAAKKIEDLENQFHQAGPPPRNERNKINQRFQKALGRFKAKEKEIEAQKQIQKEDNTDLKAKVCDQLEALLVVESPSEDRQEKIQELRDEMKKIGSSSNDKLMKKRFENTAREFASGVQAKHSKTLEEALAQLEKLCYKMENLAGIESAEISDKLRKAIMVEELASKMGKSSSRKSPQEEARAYRQEWFEIGPVLPEKRKPLTERFEKAWISFSAKSK